MKLFVFLFVCCSHHLNELSTYVCSVLFCLSVAFSLEPQKQSKRGEWGYVSKEKRNFLKKLFISERKEEIDRNIKINRLPPACFLLGFEPTIRACALAGNRTMTSWFMGYHSATEPHQPSGTFFFLIDLKGLKYTWKRKLFSSPRLILLMQCWKTYQKVSKLRYSE